MYVISHIQNKVWHLTFPPSIIHKATAKHPWTSSFEFMHAHTYSVARRSSHIHTYTYMYTHVEFGKCQGYLCWACRCQYPLTICIVRIFGGARAITNCATWRCQNSARIAASCTWQSLPQIDVSIIRKLSICIIYADNECICIQYTMCLWVYEWGSVSLSFSMGTVPAPYDHNNKHVDQNLYRKWELYTGVIALSGTTQRLVLHGATQRLVLHGARLWVCYFQ
jgi:hypothetical protein